MIKRYIMDTKLFWHIYFWWGIRQARKQRLERAKQGKSPLL